MAKEVLTKAGVAAVERMLEPFLPQIMGRLEALQVQLADLRRDFDARFRDIDLRLNALGDKLDDRYEQARDLITDVGLKVNTVDTKLETFASFMKDNAAKVDDFRERLVRVEVGQGTRKRKAS